MNWRVSSGAYLLLLEPHRRDELYLLKHLVLLQLEHQHLMLQDRELKHAVDPAREQAGSVAELLDDVCLQVLLNEIRAEYLHLLERNLRNRVHFADVVEVHAEAITQARSGERRRHCALTLRSACRGGRSGCAVR